MTRATRTTLEPLLADLAERLERARLQAEQEEQHRAADEWWEAYYLQRALERRNEGA